MTEFRESGLLFQFDNSWVVKKYDEHRYFRLLSGQGLKGVDFLGIFESKELMLIEVKNYRIRYKEKPPTAIYHILENPEILAEKIRCKAEDTLQAIRVINKFYRRNWFYKLLLPILKTLHTSYLTNTTQLFWIRAETLVEEGKVKFIFWLETEDEYEPFSKVEVAQFRATIQDILVKSKTGISFEILSVKKPKSNFNDSISAFLSEDQ